MSRVKMQVTLTFTADVNDNFSAEDIIDSVDINVLGDGEFVEVDNTELKSFFTLDSK